MFPTPRSVRMIQDREGLRRLAADELGLPTAPFWFAGSVEELTAVAEHAGFPLVVKPIAGVPGEGQSVLLRTDDVEAAWQRAVAAGRIPHNRVLAETVVEVDYEITLITVRTTGPTGPACTSASRSATARPTATVLEAWQPQQLSARALDAAKSIARAHRQRARWARRVRRRTAGPRRRGLLRRRPRRGRTTAGW